MFQILQQLLEENDIFVPNYFYEQVKEELDEQNIITCNTIHTGDYVTIYILTNYGNIYSIYIDNDDIDDEYYVKYEGNHKYDKLLDENYINNIKIPMYNILEKIDDTLIAYDSYIDKFLEEEDICSHGLEIIKSTINNMIYSSEKLKNLDNEIDFLENEINKLNEYINSNS
jgi:hypothetical protein